VNRPHLAWFRERPAKSTYGAMLYDGGLLLAQLQIVGRGQGNWSVSAFDARDGAPIFPAQGVCTFRTAKSLAADLAADIRAGKFRRAP
jgi:hypothetical protein